MTRHPWIVLAVAGLLGAACSSQPASSRGDAAGSGGELEAKAARSLAPFTILVMGDNRGETVPCGCKDNPRGGLPRRATFVSEAREAGPVLLLDAGDALFEDPYRRSEHAAAKAELVLDGMATIGTAAMAVGDRDLTEGLDWLLTRAEAAGLPLLSANLRTEDGTYPFQGHKLFQVGEAKVGVFGIFGQRAGMRTPAKLVVEDPEAAAKAQVEALRREGADLVLALVHGPSDLVRTIAQLPGVEMVVPSHDGSISLPYRPRPDAAWIIAGGQMGRTLTTIKLTLEGAGQLQDAGIAAQLVEERAGVLKNLQVARARFEGARPGTGEGESFAEQMRHLEGRDAELQHRIAAVSKVEGRRFESDQHSLGANIADEPAMAAKLEAFEKLNPAPAAR